MRLRTEPIRDRVIRAANDLERAATRQRAAQEARLARLSDRLEALDRTRRSLGYTATLSRGYAVVRKGETVVTSAEGARGALEVEFADGRVDVQAGGAAGKPGRVGKDGSDQGSLF